MHKEEKDTVKGLREYADPKSSFNVEHGKHLKVTWDMTNDDGEPVSVLCIMAKSPSDWRWKHNHQRNLKRTFRELNISTEVTHI